METNYTFSGIGRESNKQKPKRKKNKMQLPTNGTHLAATNGQMVVYQAESGSLCVAILSGLVDGSWSGKGTMVLVNAEGEAKTKNIQTLRRIFGWESEDFFGLEEVEVGAHQFNIVGEQEEYTPKATDEDPEPQPTMGYKIKWFNVLGESGVRMPDKVDDKTRRALLTKYARHFKSAPGSAKPAAKKVAAPEPEEVVEEEVVEEAEEELLPAKAVPSRSSAPARPLARTVGGQSRTMTGDEVWTAVFKKNPKVKQTELEKTYWAAADKVVPGNDGNNITPSQWGKIADELGV